MPLIVNIQKGWKDKVAYKKDQGRYVRMAAYWLLLFIAWAGLYKFRFWMDGLGAWAQTNIVPGNIPYIQTPLTISVLVSWIILPIVSAVGLYKFLNKPKVADLLIETEAELRKCTWPTLEETWRAAVVVVITVVVIGLFLAGSDFVLSKIFRFIIFPGK